MTISNNISDETESAGYNWLNSTYFWRGREGEEMQFGWNYCDGLSLGRDRKMKQKTVPKFFIT